MKMRVFLLISTLLSLGCGILSASPQCRCIADMFNLVGSRKKKVFTKCKICCFSLVLQYICMKVFKNKLKCLFQSYDCSDSEQMGRAESYFSLIKW